MIIVKHTSLVPLNIFIYVNISSTQIWTFHLKNCLKNKFSSFFLGDLGIVVRKWQKSTGNLESNLALKPMDKIIQSPKQKVPVAPQK